MAKDQGADRNQPGETFPGKPRVALFVTCLVDLFRPTVGFAAVKLLEDAGYQVDVPPAQTCCGQPAYNSGDKKDARAIAEAAFPGGRQGVILRDKLAGIKVPVQVIFGQQDQIVPAGHADGLPANVTVHRLANAGHMPHMETAGEVNRLIGDIAG